MILVLNFFIFHFNLIELYSQILSKADNNTVMEAVDPEVSVTCMDLSHVRKTFQLALLCTKRNPSERPTMHEVARVLVSLLPPPPRKTCLDPPKTVDYAQFVIDKGQQQSKMQQQQAQHNNSSDAQWLVQFGEVISKNSLWRKFYISVFLASVITEIERTKEKEDGTWGNPKFWFRWA